jgi:4-amino-4-deoxy-L-arabinose transferase-like glycosyltransferase
MFDSLKRRVRRFTAAPSGTRFRAYHERLAQRPNLMRTLLVVGCGLILLALGMVMLVLPGPGLLVAAIGAALIAGESMWVARLLDRVDLCITTKWKLWRRR